MWPLWTDTVPAETASTSNPHPRVLGQPRRRTPTADPESSLNLTKRVLDLRRQQWKNGIFTTDDGGSSRVEAGNLLICERNERFPVAVAMGSEPVRLPPGTVLLAAAAPLAEDGRLQPNNAAWVLRG